jgi:putative PIN family toxin of toxin-antitoxin system
MLKLVLDTNVLISALLRRHSPPALIVSLILQGDCKLCLSHDIFTEYKDVLARDKFKQLNRANIERLLSVLKYHALWVEPHTLADNLVKDAADKMFLECALAAEADFIITGNKKHFPSGCFKGSKIVDPRGFLNRLAEYNFL